MLAPGFIRSKKEILEGLKQLRRRQCDYMDTDDRPCNCKYGISETPIDQKYTGEQNGCPELRTVINILEKMSDEEYNSYF